jgi:penicillin amidase
MDQLPETVNPASGWIATANEMNLPADFPSDRKVGFDWPAPYRRQRIAEVLQDRAGFTAADLVALQEDFLSIPARQIVTVLAGVTFTDPAATAAARLLRDWDCVLAADSAAAALFQVWYRRHLRPALLRHALAQVLPSGQVGAALTALLPAEDLTGDARIDLRLLDSLRQQPGNGAADPLTAVLEPTLRDAMADLENLLGDDQSQWAWGRLHQAQLAHPLAGMLGEATRSRATLGPLPRGGSSDTVSATTYLPGDFTQNSGASFRVVVDVGEWDNSLAMNSPGQSGDPASPHFADLFPAWAAGEAIPLLYSRARVEAVTEQRILLVPG